MQHCDKCGNKTALVSGTYYFSADSEPYESGKELDIDLEKDERLHAQYCETCESLSEFFCDENPITGNRYQKQNEVLRERVAELEDKLRECKVILENRERMSARMMQSVADEVKSLINKGK